MPRAWAVLWLQAPVERIGQVRGPGLMRAQNDRLHSHRHPMFGTVYVYYPFIEGYRLQASRWVSARGKLQATSYRGLCHNCSQIDLDDAFRFTEALRCRGHRRVCRLPGQDNQPPQCSLCAFFSRVANVKGSNHKLEAFDIGQRVAIEPHKTQTQNGIVLSVTSVDLPEINTFANSQVIISRRCEQGEEQEDFGGEGIDWNVLRGWLNYCSANHPTCSEPNSHMKRMSTLRAIDCETLGIVELESSHHPYATLSSGAGLERQ